MVGPAASTAEAERLLSAKHSFSRACARCLHRRSLGEGVLPTFFGIDLGGAFPSFPAFPLRCCTGLPTRWGLWPFSIAQFLIWVQNSICGIQRHTIYHPPRN